MAIIDEFALKNIVFWWRYGISRHCDEWKYIIIGRIFESEIILIPPSLQISESISNGSYRNTDEVWWRYGISRSCDEWSRNETQIYVLLHNLISYRKCKCAHIATGHGGRDRMVKELGKKYANVTRDSIELFKSMCIDCQRKRVRPMTKGVVVRPILSKEFSARGQVDRIDMQSLPHGSFKWIMVYRDHLTKFVVIRPLTSKASCWCCMPTNGHISAIRCATYITERQRFRIYSSNHFRFEGVVVRASYSAW